MSTPSTHRPGRGTSSPTHPPPPRYYAGQTIQRRISIPKSTAPSFQPENMNSSDSFYSDERSIFNAIRVTTPNEDSQSHDYPFIAGPVMERGLATNMAMFIPPGSSHDGDSSTHHRYGRKRPGLDRIAWRNQLLSDQSDQRTLQPNTTPFNETEPFPSMDQQHRKAISLDTVDSPSAMGAPPRPRWPAEQTPAAVSPNHPQYPPPERAPTPPGLPSFNTPEAIQYSAQFMVGHTGTNNAQAASTSSTRTTSYGGAFRRFFGLEPVNETDANNGAVGIGRAPDGTIVQGRFPFRQSGHGTNQNRDLTDHPFHRGSLPTAAAAGTAQSGTATQSGSASAAGSQTGGRNRRVTEADTSKDQQPPSRRRPRHTGLSGLSILGRPLSSLIEERPHNRAESSQSAYPREQISPLQLPEPQYDFAQRAAARRTEVETGGTVETGSWKLSDVIDWLQSRVCSCCCLRGSADEEGSSNEPADDGPLEAITSRETYETARSENSGREGGGESASPGHRSPVQEDGGGPLGS